MNQNHVARLLFLIALLVGVVVYPVRAASSQKQSDEKRSMLKAGDRAPDFTLTDFNGIRFTLSKLTTKGLHSMCKCNGLFEDFLGCFEV